MAEWVTTIVTLLGAIGAIIALMVQSRRDTKLLEKEHQQLGKDHEGLEKDHDNIIELISGASGVLVMTREVNKKISGIDKMIAVENERRKFMDSELTGNQKDIKGAIDKINGIYTELERLQLQVKVLERENLKLESELKQYRNPKQTQSPSQNEDFEQEIQI